MKLCEQDNFAGDPTSQAAGRVRFHTGGLRRRGTILIATLTICFTLAAVVMVLSRKIAVEAIASANFAAAAQADCAERAGEQYALAVLNYAITNNGSAQSVMDINTFPEDEYYYAVPVGLPQDPSGYFWLVRPNYGDEGLPLFGLVDECSKLDINVAPGGTPPRTPAIAYNQLMMLPGMVEEVAAAIIDWADVNSEVMNTIGAESEYYQTLPEAYLAKDNPYESVDEILLVRGMNRIWLYGDGTAPYLGTPSYGMNSRSPLSTGVDPEISRGLYDLLTVDSYTPGTPTPLRGRINVNTAPRAVLNCLTGLDPTEVDALVSQRALSNVVGTTDTSWVDTAVAGALQRITPQITTGEPQRYSADILAVSRNGRAFKRVKIVIDITSGSGVIISRRDLTDRGWPMDPEILNQMRTDPDGFAQQRGRS